MGCAGTCVAVEYAAYHHGLGSIFHEGQTALTPSTEESGDLCVKQVRVSRSCMACERAVTLQNIAWQGFYAWRLYAWACLTLLVCIMLVRHGNEAAVEQPLRRVGIARMLHRLRRLQHRTSWRSFVQGQRSKLRQIATRHRVGVIRMLPRLHMDICCVKAFCEA
jgi:hypothetical protein